MMQNNVRTQIDSGKLRQGTQTITSALYNAKKELKKLLTKPRSGTYITSETSELMFFPHHNPFCNNEKRKLAIEENTYM